jgi:hypothetical protein
VTRYLAVTTCNAEQWEQYGRRMAETFRRHWSSEVQLRLYGEGFVYPVSNGVEFVDLDEAASWLADFKASHRDPRYNGGQNGMDYRRDAVRFAHKVAAIGAAAEADCDVLIWIDADVVTHAPVTVEWLDSLFPEPATVGWLDRIGTYPECGFLMLRMPAAREVIDNIVMMYRTGALFQLPEWHDSYVIQHVVTAMLQRGKAKVHSLSGPEGRKNIGHPWVSSPLAACMDHLKGTQRKQRGRSLPADLKHARPEPYWQQ